MKKVIAFCLLAALLLGIGVMNADSIISSASATDGVNLADAAAAPESTDAPDVTAAPESSKAPAAEPGMSNFQRSDAYPSGQFTDVAPEDWFSGDVRTVYELGLMRGESDTRFVPDGQVTMGQAIAMAARLHSIYNTGAREFPDADPWYEPYMEYGTAHGIAAGGEDPYAAAPRAWFADVLSRALPQSELEQVNEIVENAIPDVKTSDPYAGSVYMLYRAGIVAGNSSRGAFRPNSTISRAEAAAIMARMADKSLRKSFTLQYSGPDLTPLDPQDDSFFANSAILGNSLVEGLRMYSNLKSMRFFSATSVSVVSAMSRKNVRLNDGSYGTLIQSLCQNQYDKIYIELGINEIGGSVNTFIANYGTMIDTLRAAEPEADVYILSLLPVTRNKSNSSTSFNMTRVNMYNQALYQLAADKQCFYMDVCSPFQGGDGYLPASWSWDGVHLQARYYSVWENCIRTLY